MDAAEQIESLETGPLSWTEICELHPNEWVCLRGVENAPDGSISSARVVGHDRSMKQALSQISITQPDSMVVHTWGRPLQSPRVEMTDEIRNIIRPRR